MMINLDQLTNDKFKRINAAKCREGGWNTYVSLGEFGGHLTDRAADLITLDSEIEKLEVTIETIKEVMEDVYGDEPEDIGNTKNWYDNLQKQLAELKKTREELK